MSGRSRCPWGEKPEIYVAYHDTEWGVPVTDDQRLFEFLVLETFQAGLSWLTVLRKREAFRQAFEDFDPAKVAGFDAARAELLRGDASIIRNRAKIAAAISNAQAFLAIQESVGSFSEYIWGFVDHRPIVNAWQNMSELPVYTPLAETISKDLKGRGFKFVGPTMVYSLMQATGMVNDHLVDCFRHTEVNPEPASTDQ